MLQRQLSSAGVRQLCQNLQHLLACPPVCARPQLQQQHYHHTRNRSSMSAAAADPAGAAAAAATAAADSTMESVVVFDRSALQRTIRGVVFDMDGTLTVPVIDFQYMRQV